MRNGGSVSSRTSRKPTTFALKELADCTAPVWGAALTALTLELDHHENFRTVRNVHEVDLVDEANAAALTDMIQRLDEIANVKEGWLDGDGTAISPRAIEKAREFVIRSLNLVGSMLAFPSPEGGVTIQMRNDQYSGSIDFEPEGEVEFVLIGLGDQYDFDESYNGVETPLIENVIKFFGRDGY